MLVEPKHYLTFTEEELQIIKLGLLGKLSPRSPRWQQAQELAAQIPVEIEKTPANRGLTQEIYETLERLGTATSQEIVEYLGLDYPNSVSVLCSKLYRKGKLEREETEIDPRDRKSRGVKPMHYYRLPKKSDG